MVLGPVAYPAEVLCATVSALQNDEFSRWGGDSHPYPLKLRPCFGRKARSYIKMLSNSLDSHMELYRDENNPPS